MDLEDLRVNRAGLETRVLVDLLVSLVRREIEGVQGPAVSQAVRAIQVWLAYQA